MLFVKNKFSWKFPNLQLVFISFIVILSVLKVLWIFKNIFETLHDLNDTGEKTRMLKTASKYLRNRSALAVNCCVIIHFLKVSCKDQITSRGQRFHSSARNYEGNLERTSNSSQSTRPIGRVLWEELLKEVILHITPLCSLLHTFLKDKYMHLQEEWKL